MEDPGLMSSTVDYKILLRRRYVCMLNFVCHRPTYRPINEQLLLISRSGIIVYIEYQNFVGIGSFTPFPPKRVCLPLPPPGSLGGATLASGGGRGVEGPNSYQGTDTVLLYVYYNSATYSELKRSIIVTYSAVLLSMTAKSPLHMR